MGAGDWDDLNLLWDRYPSSSPNNKIRALLRALAEFTVYPSTHTFWRGHSSHEYRLQPSACRGTQPPTQGALEKATEKLLESAREASRSWRNGAQFSQLQPLQQLSHLQHHGLSTPLLDMTPDPMIALWMACRTSSDAAGRSAPVDGLLIGFNVDSRWVDVSKRTEPYPTLAPVLQQEQRVGWMRPPISDDRIVVQRSRMLVSWIEHKNRWHSKISDVWLPDPTRTHIGATGADAKRRLAGIFNPTQGRPSKLPALAFRIPRQLKGALRKVLENHYGVSKATLFPDPGGVAAD